MAQFLANCNEDNNLYQLFISEQNVLDKSLFYINKDEIILWHNKYAQKLFKHNMIGKTAWALFSKETAGNCAKDNLEIIRSKSSLYINETIKLTNGKEEDFFTIKTPWIVGGEQVAGIFVSSFGMGQFEDEAVANSCEDKDPYNLLSNKLQSLCLDIQPSLKELLITTENHDKYLDLQKFTKKLLFKCEKVLKNNGITNSKMIPIRSQSMNLKNLIQEVITEETKIIKRPNFRFIYNAIDQVFDVVIGDFFKTRKIIQLIIRNLLKSAPKIETNNIICQIILVYHKNFNVLIMFETRSYLFEKWFLKEQNIQYKLSLIPELSSYKDHKLGLFLIKDLIKELNGNIELINCNQNTKMIIDIPLHG